MAGFKLPDLPAEQPQPVQGFGEVEYALQHQGYAGQQLGHAISQTALSLEHLGLEVRTGQLAVQSLTARKNLHAMQTDVLTKLNTQQEISEDQLGQIYGGVENIPKEIRDAIPGGTKVQFKGADGTVHETGRADIPMYAVRAQIFKHLMEPNIDTVSAGIDEPGWQRTFRLGAKLDLEQNVQNVAHRDAQEAVFHANTLITNEFQSAIRSGDFGGAEMALKMGGASFLPGRKAQMQQQLDIAKSEWVPNEVISGTDVPRIKSLMEGLQNITTNQGKFRLKDSYGQTEDVDTSDLKEAQRRSFVRMAGARIKTLEHLDNAEEAQKDLVLYRDSAGLLNRMYETGDLNGIRNFQGMMRQTGRAEAFINQDLPEKLYMRAHAMAKLLDPKAVKEPKNNVDVIALRAAAEQYANGQEVTVQNPQTGERFQFDNKDWNTDSFLESAHAFTPAQADAINNTLNGKKTTQPQMEKIVSELTKSIYGTNADELAALPKAQRKEDVTRNIGDKQEALRTAALEYLKDHQGRVTPEQWDRFRQGILKSQGKRTLTEPNSFFNTQSFSTKEYEPGKLISEVPGRVLMELQANHAKLGLPTNTEDQAAFWKEFMAPYQNDLRAEYFKKFQSYKDFEVFLPLAAAAIRDNQAHLAVDKKTTSSAVAKYIVDHFDWKTATK